MNRRLFAKAGSFFHGNWIRFHTIAFPFGAVLNNCFGLLFSVKNAHCFGFSV